MPDLPVSQSSPNTGPASSDEATVPLNPDAPAGSPSSVGAQSRRDGRPSTCDDVVEAIDEAGPGPKEP